MAENKSRFRDLIMIIQALTSIYVGAQVKDTTERNCLTKLQTCATKASSLVFIRKNLKANPFIPKKMQTKPDYVPP